MQRNIKIQRNGLTLFFLFFLLGLLSSFCIRYFDELGIRVNISRGLVEGFTTIFLSVILEAIPFIMIGALVSSLIQMFVSDRFISKIIPRNLFVGLLVVSLTGLIFPVCECAIVPIMRSLVKKGVPTHFAITFMLAVPIVNPVVLTSTYYAFSGKLYMVLLRGVLGLIAAIVIGYLIGNFYHGNPLKESRESSLYGCTHSDHHDHNNQQNEDHRVGCTCASHGHLMEDRPNFVVKFLNILEHTSIELYQVGRFLIFGAFLSSLMQTFVSKDFIFSIGQGSISSVLVMMALAFVLSLCSEADAFIARTFVSQFTTGSIMGFLILGPMIDIKNTIMLAGVCKGRFVFRLIGIIFLVIFILAVIVNQLGI